MTETKPLTTADLSQFIGTENYYPQGLLKGCVMTDGVKYLADHGKAYWLTDLIASWQCDPKVQKEAFQHWTLKVNTEAMTAVATCDDGNDNILATQRIEFTDFPLTEVDLYFINDGDHSTILLPSEY